MFGRARDSRGAGLIEGAIISPLLFLLTFSIMEFGTMLYVHLALVNGVSQATPTLTIPNAAFSFSHIPPGGSTWVGVAALAGPTQSSD